jgi:hypothetical protein
MTAFATELQRGYIHAASAKRCCVSEVRKTNDGKVRIADLGAIRAANVRFPPSQDLGTERSEWLLRGAGSKTATVRLAGAMRLSDKGGEDVS